MKTRITFLAIICMLFAMMLPARAQVSMTGSGSYLQNFDSFGTTTVVWTSNSTLANWWAQWSGTNTNLTASTGSSTAGSLYNYGKAGGSDRALGSQGSGPAGNFAYGVQFQNNTAYTLTDVTVAYIGEQWRKSGDQVAQTDSFSYKVSPTLITNLTPGSNTGWTRVSALDFTSPVYTAGGAALNGDSSVNRTKIPAVSLPGLSIPAGSYLMIKWDDINHPGNDHGLAIDSVEVVWTIPPPDVTPPTAIDAWATSISHVVVAFDEPLDATQAETASNYTWFGTTQTATATLRPSADTVDLTLSTPLVTGVPDSLFVCCVEDIAMNPMTGIAKFEVIAANLDVTPPAAIDAWATDLSHVTVAFDEPLFPMDAIDVSNYNWFLTTTTGSASLRPTHDSVDLVLSVPLQSGVTDTLYVSGLNDTALNTMSVIYKFPINILFLDTFPPVAIDAYAVALNHVVVAFNEPIFTMGPVILSDYSFLHAVTGSLTYRPTNDTADLILSTPLLLGVTDSLTVCCVTDTALNPIANPYKFPITFGTMPVDSLVYWVFPTNPDDTLSDGGIPANIGRSLTREPSYPGVITYATGVTTAAARSLDWDGGAGTKYWVVNFTTLGYDSIQFSSRQRSSGTGPRDWKVEYSIDNLWWFDVNGTNITVPDNWTTGALNNISLPVFVNNKTNVWLRWIMTSDSANNAGTLVQTGGSSRIDNILVHGRLNPLVNVNSIQSPVGAVNIYPNPNNGNFRIDFSAEAQRNDIMILSATGSVVYRAGALNSSVDIDLSGFGKGLYFIRITDMTTNAVTMKKVVVE